MNDHIEQQHDQKKPPSQNKGRLGGKIVQGEVTIWRDCLFA